MNAEEPNKKPEERRSDSSILLILLATAAVAGALIMFWLGMGALGMSGRNMVLNKLLNSKTKACADRSRQQECEKIIKQIEELEKKMAAKQERQNGSGP